MEHVEMKSLEGCRFCDIASYGKYYIEGVDEPFASNEDYVAIASIGALVEGWSLVVPKSHQFSMRNDFSNPLFREFVQSVSSKMFAQYGSLISFEHGANKVDSATACGTAHAHLHLVPFNDTLMPALEESSLEWVSCRTSEIASKSEGKEYLFYYELNKNDIWQDPIGYLSVLDYPISQFFRRLIAEKNGKDYDYKTSPHLENSKNTRQNLAKSFQLVSR